MHKVGDQESVEVCEEYCRRRGRGHVHLVPCDGGVDCANKQKAPKGALRIHAPHTFDGREYDMLSCGLFWKEKGWVAPYAGDEEFEAELKKCGYYCGHKVHSGG